jgi:Fe-S-cluster containining protein
MWQQGCCTGDTGRAEGKGIKRFKDTRTGVVYEMCGALKKDSEGWYCGDYGNRPDICRIFDCDRSIRERLGDSEF